MTGEALRALAEQVEACSGIWLERGGRLGSLARLKGVAAVGPASAPDRELINAVTVNHTWFFRDGEQMGVLAQLLRTGWPAGRPVHLWVAGCSTGEDAYSLALLAEEAGRPAQILATDINTAALARAAEGRYSAWALREFPARFRGRLRPDGKQFGVEPSLRERVRFDWHNLVQPPPRPEGADGWDLILCRNVLIYFRLERAVDTLGRLGAALRPGGWLFLGSSEVIYGAPENLEIVQHGTRVGLRRTAGGAPGTPRAATPARPAPPAASSTVLPAPSRSAPCLSPSPTPPPAQAISRAPAPAPTLEPAAGSPGEPDAVHLVSEGNALLDAGKAEEALERYALAQGADPLFAEAHLCSGIALHLLDDPARAADALRSALFLCPSLWPASFYLALCYQSLGLERDARLEYERLLATVEQPVELQSRGRLVSDLHAWKQEVRLLARKRLQALAPRSAG